MVWMTLGLWWGAFRGWYSFRDAWRVTWSIKESHEMMDDMEVGQEVRFRLQAGHAYIRLPE